MAEAVFSEDVPTMTLSGFMKSETASPSLRNSGFDTTSKAMSSPRAARAAATSSRTRSAVPTGTVDLSTTMSGPRMCSPIWRGHAFHKGKIAGAIGTRGRPTVMKANSASSNPSARLVVNRRRPSCRLRLTRSSRPGSKIWIRPLSSRATTSGVGRPHSGRHCPFRRNTPRSQDRRSRCRQCICA